MSATMKQASAAPLLSVQNLRTEVKAGKGGLTVLDDLSFDIGAGEVLALVGESGSGKSMAALSIMRLLSYPACTVGGRVLFEGQDLLALKEAEMQRVRGARISMIFQEPMSSLNPVFTIGDQIGEAIRFHEGVSRKEAHQRAIGLLDLVQIPSAARRADEYPHQLSGGMRQRVMIAIGLACRPKLLIADEPTTALDVTVQAQILDLLRDVQRELDMAVLLITHDLGIVTEFADRVMVMYAGRTAESAPVERLFNAPAHPYTQGLLQSIPPLDEDIDELVPIAGAVPSLADMPDGCRYASRCPLVIEACRSARPPLIAVGGGQSAACIRLDDARQALGLRAQGIL
jgi:oligopeptide/dipeptide ABC transporter ATP-binding protein